MVFTLRDYEQVVLSKPIHPQLDEGVFREICDKYGDYALGLINRHQIGDYPQYQIFDSDNSEFQAYVRNNIDSIMSLGWGSLYMFLFTKSDVDTVLKVKKWEPTLYTVSQDNDCFEALNIELRTTPDIQKVSIEDEEKDNIYISVEEKIQILGNIDFSDWKSQLFRIDFFQPSFYRLYKVMMYFSLQDDLAEWTDFLRYIDKNYPRVQLDIFNESGNLVVAQKKNQKMPRLIWCDTFEPLLLDHDESQNKKLLWIFECTLHIVGMNSNMLSEEEFKEFYMKYYNSNSPIF